MSRKSLTEKLLTKRFQELAELRDDNLPDVAPESLQTEVFETIDQVGEATDIDVDELLNVGSATATADFLNEIVEPEVAAND